MACKDLRFYQTMIIQNLKTYIMKRNEIKWTLAAVLVIGLMFTSCNKDDDENEEVFPNEYVATDASFESFSSWTLGAELMGADPSLGMAHGGNDSTAIRSIYFRDNAKPVNGQYAVGTLIVKYSHNPAGSLNEHTAMVKRGNGFDSDNGDWEYFMLSGDGKIATDADGMQMRGDGPTMMGGMCLSCHSHASGQDFIFTSR